MKKLLRLFFEMFKTSLFVIGGGYAIIAVCDDVFSRRLKWTKEGELMDMLPLYQSIPGIIAAHNAVYVGRKVAGWRGAAVALAGATLPSVAVFTAVSMGYDFIPLENPWLNSAFAGLRAALTGVIGGMLARMWTKDVCDALSYTLFLVAFAALMTPGVPAIGVIFLAVAGGVAASLAERRPGGTGRRAAVFRSSLFAPLLFLRYGLAAFGGGHVLVPVYLQDFVGPSAQYLQIAPSEFANLMALTQMTPGPVGINAATYFGYRLFGVWGGVVATFCIVLPGFAILSLALASLDRFRKNAVVESAMRWVRPVSAALTCAAFVSFVRMSCFVPDHGSWCTFGSAGFNAGAALLASAVLSLTVAKRAGIMSLVVASAALACIFRI